MGTYEIVGVVHDARFDRAAEECTPTLYVPMLEGVDKAIATDEPDGSIYAHDLLVHVVGEPAAAEMVRKAILDVDPNMPIESVRTLHEQVNRSIGVYSAIRRSDCLVS